VCALSHPASALKAKLAPLLAELYDKGGCKKYALTQGELEEILLAIGQKYLPEGAPDSEIRNLYSTLRIEELVLARACAAGSDSAWQDFMIRYREKLHDAALAITREDSQARELAGSIYADLYGTGEREGKRMSKLSYYNGRGSLEGWLRTVLAQRHVNEYRGGRKNVSLDEEEESGKQFVAAEAQPPPQVDPRLNTATDAALAAISPEDRCILAYYFLDDLTLAKIASILGVHESTISRRIEKLVRGLRKHVLGRLTQMGLSRRQAEEALDVDVRDLTVDIRRRLTQDLPAGAFSKEKVIRAGEGQD
jgi:RNA polymerase sigma-70 factor, ECF subfamily